MKKSSFAFTLATVLLCLSAVIFSSCETDGGNDGTLVGGWIQVGQYGVDYYVITVDKDGNGRIRYDSGYGDAGGDYTGDIEVDIDFESTSGVIIFKYTSPASLAGKHCAAYWKELTANSVYMSNAINPDYTNPGKATLDEAISAFTLDKASDWVSIWGGPYTKQ